MTGQTRLQSKGDVNAVVLIRFANAIVTLRREIAILRYELVSQWEENHFEHCGRLPHQEGKACMWPYPLVLQTPTPTVVFSELLQGEKGLSALLGLMPERNKSATKNLPRQSMDRNERIVVEDRPH